MPPQVAVQKEYLMWNAMKTKSLAGAMLITATIHGSLLWKMNDVATEATSGMSQTSVNKLLAGSTQAHPEIRYVTLEPVVVVGKYNPLMPDQIMAQAAIPSSATQGRCTNSTAKPVALNGRNDSQFSYC